MLGSREKPSRVGRLKSPAQHGQIKHRRGPSTPRHKSCASDQSARRFAQDDDSVGVSTKNSLDKLALMGFGQSVSAEVRSHGKPGQVGEPGAPSHYAGHRRLLNFGLDWRFWMRRAIPGHGGEAGSRLPGPGCRATSAQPLAWSTAGDLLAVARGRLRDLWSFSVPPACKYRRNETTKVFRVFFGRMMLHMGHILARKAGPSGIMEAPASYPPWRL